MKQNLPHQNPMAGVITLIYHRVEKVDTNPWGICVSPQNFEQQVCFLKENFNVISVDELEVGMVSGSSVENSVCITFDDGYADNYIHAKPILEKYNCAAVFFIATSFINQTNPFWWDELETIFLHSKKLPPQLNIRIGNDNLSYTLNGNELTKQQWLQHKKWKWHQLPPTDRCKIFFSIWEKLTALTFEKVVIVINELNQWSCIDKKEYPVRLPMNADQLNEFSKNDLFTFAMHTHTHCDLSQQKKQIQLEEINVCKTFLRTKFDMESPYFSYPFGRYNSDTIQIVKELQFKACFTTDAVLLNKAPNKFLLGRFQPMNWNKNTFKKHLDVWLCQSGR